jgi:hypothetical protein
VIEFSTIIQLSAPVAALALFFEVRALRRDVERIMIRVYPPTPKE